MAVVDVFRWRASSFEVSATRCGRTSDREQTGRRSDDQRSPVIAFHLPAEQMKVLRWRSWINDMHVDPDGFVSLMVFTRIIRKLDVTAI